jgi:hypothetical protein
MGSRFAGLWETRLAAHAGQVRRANEAAARLLWDSCRYMR